MCLDAVLRHGWGKVPIQFSLELIQVPLVLSILHNPPSLLKVTFSRTQGQQQVERRVKEYQRFSNNSYYEFFDIIPRFAIGHAHYRV